MYQKTIHQIEFDTYDLFKFIAKYAPETKIPNPENCDEINTVTYSMRIEEPKNGGDKKLILEWHR